MGRLTLWISIAVVTFVVGIYTLHRWRLHYPPTVERPPCQSCASVYAAEPSGVSAVTPCELVSDFRRYENRIVRVRMLVKHDAGYFGMAYGDCPARGPHTQVVFDASTKSCAGAKKILDDRLGHHHWCWIHPFGFDGLAEATVVGRLERADDAPRFVVLCVEEAVSTRDGYAWH